MKLSAEIPAKKHVLFLKDQALCCAWEEFKKVLTPSWASDGQLLKSQLLAELFVQLPMTASMVLIKELKTSTRGWLKSWRLSPASCGDGAHHHGGNHTLPCLCDNVFQDAMKFNKSRRVVESSCPSGVTDDDWRMNMPRRWIASSRTSHQPSGTSMWLGWNCKTFPNFLFQEKTCITSQRRTKKRFQELWDDQAHPVSASVLMTKQVMVAAREGVQQRNKKSKTGEGKKALT